MNKHRFEPVENFLITAPFGERGAIAADLAYIDDANEFLGVAEDWSCEAPRRKRREHSFAEWEAAR